MTPLCGGATCVILGTSVTTATTYSAIDEALSPCMLHLVDSVFEVVICARSVSVHSSDCHRANRARRVVGSLLKMRSFLSVLKSPFVSVVLSSQWPCPGWRS